MVDYPTDIKLNEEKDVYLNAANDIAVISGRSQLEQSVAIDIMDELPEFIGNKVTGKNIGLLEERIKRGLEADPQVSEIQTVRIQEYNRQTNTLTVAVNLVSNDEFTLEITE